MRRFGSKRALALAIAIASVAWTPLAHATIIDLSWGGNCSPIVTSHDPSGAEPIRFVVSATGQGAPHKAYEFWIAISRPGDGLPDAWRFDAEGCQGRERIDIAHARVIDSKSCPNFQGANESIQIKNFQWAPEFLGFPQPTAVAVMANTYPAGVTTTNPSTRSLLGSVLFDHTNSVAGVGEPGVSCGGYEESVCFRLIGSRCNWLTLDGTEVPFVFGQWWLTFRNENECLSAVPAQNATWGLLKSRYRR